MGGQDKAALTLDGVTLLDRVLAACAAATRVVVVGPPRPATRPVVWCREDPPGAGPAAAVAAALPLVATEVMVLLAVDLPALTPATVQALLDGLDGLDADGVQAVDGDGRVQPLLSAYRTTALRAAAAEVELVDAPMKALTGSLVLSRLVVDPRSAADVDTLDDWAAAGG